MALFQTSVLKSHLALLDESVVEKAYKKYQKYFWNTTIQENIKSAKEEQYQATFLNELFVNILGYTLFPNPNPNLTTEFKNEKNARKADGAILKDGVAIGVIELKGTNTKDLESIRRQAFDYKANQKGCVYVITSNFEKLRFYIDDATEFEAFDLFTLTPKQFKLLYLCLHKDSVHKNIPFKIKEASIVEEEEITKAFYKDYSLFKRELYRDLVKNNAKTVRAKLGESEHVEDKDDLIRLDKNVKLTLFKKSQKLIDRFLFIYFAEDRNLLPSNSTLQILNKWKNDWDFGDERPLYDLFKQYFNFLDIGRKGTENRAEIYAYNGGLFKPDAILDALEIDNDLLYKYTVKLSNYDFESQVDVNILGHIFENSLNEIESVNAEIEGGDFDKQTSKRKKDGVFYTPKYITKYIVENTVGKLCNEKKEALGFKEADYFEVKKGTHQNTKKQLLDILDTYREWLLKITICDPACGSGAFLNQALDFLIKEHTYIDELKTKILGGGLQFPDIENTILENNIYGVDLNEESVEIAKLSLWLRTAQPRRKLNNLSSNIKCGNSLIDSKAVAGDKAFKWDLEFPDIFENGGFDVIIGNPPYVGEKGHSEIFEALKKIPKWKEFYRRRSNTYYYFIKHGIDLLKNKGIQSLIVPREFTNADWANKVRGSILASSKIIEIIDFSDLKVFADAGTTSLIITQEKVFIEDYKFHYTKINKQKSIQDSLSNNTSRRNIDIKSIITEENKPWDFNSFKIDIGKGIVNLSTCFNVSQGIVSGCDRVTKKHLLNNLVSDEKNGRGIFILKENIDIKFIKGIPYLNVNKNWIELKKDDCELIKPYYKPENLQKWSTTKTDLYIIYIGDKQMTDNIKKYLLQFEKILLNRSTISSRLITLKDFLEFSLDDIKEHYSSAGAVQKIMRKKQWYLPLYERASIPFKSFKIVVNTKNMNVFTYSDTDLYSSGGGAGGQNFIYPKLNSDLIKPFVLNRKIDHFVAYINSILNSRLIYFLIHLGQFNQLSTAKISDLPIKVINNENLREKFLFDSIVAKTILLREYFKDINNHIIKFTFFVDSCFTIILSQYIQDWYELEFGSFIDELNKGIKSNNKLRINEGLEEVATLTKKDEFEWMELFEENKKKANALQTQIAQTEKEIDQMVYELYGLSDEEIQIVENI